ncbi:MAG: 50S ribosomal protein L15 [Candidatus Yanofskybacteria bacterium]|nr:50S ribosomal protein L15 [Candidatus Yanofskybacteria bacterium]
MQLHQVKPKIKKKHSKRVGRGGKRGTYSGHGMKGQKSRAGARIRPGFRGGDNPIWKLFPKQRGSSRQVEIKHKRFDIEHTKMAAVNLGTLNDYFKEGETVTASSLVKRGIINSTKNGVKILGSGTISKKINFSGVKLSKSAQAKVLEVGGTVKN